MQTPAKGGLPRALNAADRCPASTAHTQAPRSLDAMECPVACSSCSGVRASGDAGEARLPPAEASAPQKPKKKRVRREQVELKFLRVQVRRLEHQLEQLTQSPRSRASPMELPTARHQEQKDSWGKPTGTFSVWEGIAERQARAMMRSEKENKTLKGHQSAYAELLLELKRKLRKGVGQAELDMLADCEAKQQTFWSSSLEDDADLFADQFAYLLRVYHQLGSQHVLSPNTGMRFRCELSPALESVHPNPRVPGGITLEMRCGTMIPFDLDVAAQAYWQMFRPHKVERAAFTSKDLRTTDNVATQTIQFELEHDGKMMQLWYKQTCRRYKEKDGITITWAANAWPVGYGGMKFRGLVLQKVGWIKLCRGGRHAQGLQQSSSSSTVVEMGSKSIPIFRKGVPDQELQIQAYISMVRKVHGTLSEGFSQRLSRLLVEEDWKARYGSEVVGP